MVGVNSKMNRYKGGPDAKTLTMAKNVRRGVKLLDKQFPTWRKTMKAHASAFNIRSTKYCVLGTLEHELGRARVLRKRAGQVSEGYWGLVMALGITPGDYGFSIPFSDGFRYGPADDQLYDILNDLWRAEFEN